MESTYKLKVRVGDAEFEAEGPEDCVRDQFDLFMGCLADSGTLREKRSKTEESESGRNRVDDIEDALSIDKAMMDRAYRTDEKGQVSLRTLPNGDSTTADALILLLYGIQKLKKVEDVTAIELTSSARQSGINLSRIDRTLATQEAYVRKGGRAKGTRYSLNNPGENKAEDMLEDMYN